MPLDPKADAWDLPIADFEILDVWFSGRIYLVAFGSGGNLARGVFAPRSSIAIGGPFTFCSADDVEHRLDGGGAWEALVPLLGLRHVRITRATANRQGHLQITFSDGSSLNASPDDRYENWEIGGPGALNLVSPPGGGDPRIAD